MKHLLSILFSGNALVAPKLWVAGAITLAFAGFGRLVRGVTSSGAVAGAAVCLGLFAGSGWAGFVGLCAVFFLTWAATRFGYAHKQKLGTAESRSGRTAAQVLANLGVATGFGLAFALFRESRLLLAVGAALAEAAADTVSSEIGQAIGGRPRLVTTWSVVPPGMDGAVSVAGTAAGMGAALIVAMCYAWAGVLGWRGVLVCSIAGIAGTLADSVLGATIERRGRLGNNAVNLCSTLVAAGLALLLG